MKCTKSGFSEIINFYFKLMFTFFCCYLTIWFFFFFLFCFGHTTLTSFSKEVLKSKHCLTLHYYFFLFSLKAFLDNQTFLSENHLTMSSCSLTSLPTGKAFSGCHIAVFQRKEKAMSDWQLSLVYEHMSFQN